MKHTLIKDILFIIPVLIRICSILNSPFFWNAAFSKLEIIEKLMLAILCMKNRGVSLAFGTKN